MLIQKLRLQHGWSQQQLADLSGLSMRTIQRLQLQRTDMNTAADTHPPRSPGISHEEMLAFNHVRKLKGRKL